MASELVQPVVVVVVLLSLLSLALPWTGNCSIHKIRDSTTQLHPHLHLLQIKGIIINRNNNNDQDHTTSTTASLSSNNIFGGTGSDTSTGPGTGSALLPLTSFGFYSAKENPVPPSGPSRRHNKIINSQGPTTSSTSVKLKAGGGQKTFP